MARTYEELIDGAGRTALTIQRELQAPREYKANKHFRVTEAEFLLLMRRDQENSSTLVRTMNVGWHEFCGVPLWVD